MPSELVIDLSALPIFLPFASQPEHVVVYSEVTWHARVLKTDSESTKSASSYSYVFLCQFGKDGKRSLLQETLQERKQCI